MIKTSGVLAGRYVSLKTTLTHAVEYGADGWAVKVLCTRITLQSIAAEHELDASDKIPTCPTCARRLARLCS